MKTYLCDDRAESVLSAIYDAWADPVPNSEIRLEIGKNEQLSFLSESVRTEESYEKAEKVILAVQKKLGFRMWKMTEGALCAGTPDKADAVFQFLRYGFYRKTDVTEELAVPQVMRAFELNRKSRGEAHLLTGFVRFDSLDNGAFFAKIGPVNDVLPLIADHFAERFNIQPFMIYDEKRKKSVVYVPGTNWYFVEGEVNFGENGILPADEYRSLWKSFFDGVTIRERMNPVCQRSHCPLHFREYMTEFH